MSDDPAPPIIEFKPTGAIVCPGLSFDEWQGRWESAIQVEQGSRWWLGDVLAYGEDWFPEQWSQVLDPKFAEHHRGVMRVSRRIPFANRRESLSWSSHRAAASGETVEERVELLDMAEANGWDSRAIAAEVRRRRDIRRGNGGPPLDPDSVRSTWNESATFGSPEEIDGRPVLVALGGRGDPSTGPRPLDTPPTPEAISEAIAAVRKVSNEIALGRDIGSGRLGAEIAAAACLGVPIINLTSYESALRALPATWKGKIVIEFGEDIFGGRTHTVTLTRPGGKLALGLAPTLPCALVDAALAARLSDLGAT